MYSKCTYDAQWTMKWACFLHAKYLFSESWWTACGVSITSLRSVLSGNTGTAAENNKRCRHWIFKYESAGGYGRGFTGLHCKENTTNVLPEKELRDLSPNFLNVSVSDLYIPSIGPPIFLQQNRQTDHGNIMYKSLTETWLRPRSSGNIWFKISVYCLCSLGDVPTEEG